LENKAPFFPTCFPPYSLAAKCNKQQIFNTDEEDEQKTPFNTFFLHVVIFFSSMLQILFTLFPILFSVISCPLYLRNCFLGFGAQGQTLGSRKKIIFILCFLVTEYQVASKFAFFFI